MPKRDSETFISAIGHLDGRVDLYKIDKQSKEINENDSDDNKVWQNVELGNRALMDLCMMSSKLAYENDKVVRNVVDLHWKVRLCSSLIYLSFYHHMIVDVFDYEY